MKILQKIYTYNLIGALVICAILLMWLILISLTRIQPNIMVNIIVMVPILIFFLLINVFLKFQNKQRDLELPAFMPKKLAWVLPILATLIFFSVLIYGVIAYKHAPLNPVGDIFIDKAGNEYTLTQFQNFLRWQRALVITCCISFLQIFVNVPFIDEKTGIWSY